MQPEPPPAGPAPPARPAATVFFKDSNAPRLGGLRAGWRLAIWLALLACGLWLAGLGSRAFPHGAALDPSAPIFMVAVDGPLFVATLCVTAIMAVLECRPFGDFGLPARQAFGTRFWTGAAWGLASLSLLLLAIAACGDFRFGAVALHGRALADYAAAWAVAFLVVGLTEEFLFRGYALVTLQSGIPFWPAAVVLSLCFGNVHLGNSGEDWVGAAAAAAIGLFFCFTFRRTGNLWFATGLHAAWDWGESFLYGVPDSGVQARGHFLSPPPAHGPAWITGGSVGPEGSVWVFVVIALMWILFDRVYRQTPESPLR